MVITEATGTVTGGVCALVPAAGRGVRFGGSQNKVFTPLLGRPLLGWTLEAFANCSAVDAIVLVGSSEDIPHLREIGTRYGGGKLITVVEGGADRQTSVRLGLAACEGYEYVAVHDGARPCITPTIISDCIEAARTYEASFAVIPVADTLVRAEPDQDSLTTVSRDNLWAVQTPQVFRRSLLAYAHDVALRDDYHGTDDAGLVDRLGNAVRRVSGSPENLKVTRPEDLALAEAILAPSGSPIIGGGGGFDLRVGYGYDVHALAEGRRLFLGGVEFPNAPRGLLGHSDADVLLHALCDALLGAAGMGDIGKLFPPSDDAHKDRPSLEFLSEVKARLNAVGWRVSNVDMTVIAESPKIGPFADAMKANISVVLGITPEQVGIKATTNEGLGFVGRGEGIAAHATALLLRP